MSVAWDRVRARAACLTLAATCVLGLAGCSVILQPLSEPTPIATQTAIMVP